MIYFITGLNSRINHAPKDGFTWSQNANFAATVFYLCGGCLFYHLDAQNIRLSVQMRRERFLAFRDQVLRARFQMAMPGMVNDMERVQPSNPWVTQ